MAKFTAKPVEDSADVKIKEDQENLFKELTLDGLKEIAQFMGVRDTQIPEDVTREDMLKLLAAAKRQDISVAKTFSHNGKTYDCPPGYMVIRVTPKAAGPGTGWGNKSKEAFFFAVQGEAVVGRRGVEVVIPIKYRSAWSDAIRYDYELNGDAKPDGTNDPAPMKRYEVFAEDVAELFINRDVEAEKEAERLLIENSKRFMEEKRAAKALGLADLIKQASNR